MTQNILEKLTEKYGRCEADPVGSVQLEEQSSPRRWQDSKSVSMLSTAAGNPQAILTDWKQSEPVSKLSAFLKENDDQGFYLKQTKNGFFILNLEPGLKQETYDPDRWAHAIHALELIDDAREDLKQLISNGALSLPIYKGILK